MMVLKRMRDPNQTIDLTTSAEEMEDTPGPDPQLQSKELVFFFLRLPEGSIFIISWNQNNPHS